MTPFAKALDLPNTDTHDCFGCSPRNALGLQMKFSTDGETVWSPIVVPPHLCGWGRVVHGGIVSTLLDETMGWTGLFTLQRVTVTRRLTVDFLHAVEVGRPLRVSGQVMETSGRHEVRIAGALYDASETLCARADGHFKLLSLKAAQRLGLMSSAELEAFFAPLAALRP